MKGHVDFLLLATLREGPLHGYGVVEKLRGASEGAFDLAEGTVYPVLHRLEAEGLLASSWSTVAGRRRRVYRLTKRGEKALAARADEWRAFSSAVEAVLG